LNNHNENKAPATAIGTVKIMMNGSIKLSNCADKIKKISSSKANPKANEVRTTFYKISRLPQIGSESII
jgi:hypothetical protein